MPVQRYNSRKIIKTSDIDTTSGINVNPGPYVGIVKNNVDVLRYGRLQVYIPVIGGPNPDDPTSWINCCYASPFFGHTNMLSTDQSSGYDRVSQGYGFWMVPPDPGVQVLIIFANGDINLAYWIACVPEPFRHHMVPALGSRTQTAVNLGLASAATRAAAAARPAGQYPSSEVNIQDQRATDVSRFYSDPQHRAIHEDVYRRLLVQGLDVDTVRGTITSSSQRESPSNVFGFSSPGRLIKDLAAEPNAETLARQGDITAWANDGTRGRRGGHSLVFDDGDILGRDMLVRLRTARGHQILMHDTEDLIYISSANGRTWIELSADGQVQIYAANSISLRTQRDFNVHADGNINLNAGGSIRLHGSAAIKAESADITALSKGGMSLQADSSLTLKSEGILALQSGAAMGMTAGGAMDLMGATIGFNTAQGPQASGVAPLPQISHADTTLQGPVYVSATGAITSINPVVPTHEPYPGHPAPKTSSQRASIIKGE
jgi:hypothetical protein